MGDRVVGLLDGCAVYEDGHGGYEADVTGQRVAIKPSFHSHIKFCFEHHHEPSVGGAKRRRQDDHNGPAAAAAAAAAAAVGGGAAVSNGNNGNIPDDFMRYPSGAYHKVLALGTGRVPKATDRVKFDHVGWADAFDGQDKVIDKRGAVSSVSDRGEWLREALLSMRVGEVRRIITPPGWLVRYVEVRLVSIE
ncbi:unnamed protein product [Vitrella brassicaformis CCMP3155]|uniref:Uncharacterized protein n=1 Tax=Vitrella brassicaformis (strain CCMP3155) TaxID=1169540 RepID=A0A0G4H4U1_VITBC|nr:unnamed protein product [Vitrella brassicaformis CCMP3155]|eukprot:CEM38803.1 unnamed protein product [Vitrella brassicaformis CCMP3155]